MFSRSKMATIWLGSVALLLTSGLFSFVFAGQEYQPQLRGSTDSAMLVTGPDGAIANNDVVQVSVPSDDTALVRIDVQSLGVETALQLGQVVLTGDAAISLETGFDQLTLELDETTFFEVLLASDEPGSYAATASFATNVQGDENFSIEFELEVLPISIAGYAYEDWRSNAQRNPGDPPLEGALVFLDVNNDGEIEPPPASSISVGVNLPFGNNPTQVSSTIAVFGLPEQLLDVEVLLNIDHAYASDVRVRLTSPEGLTRTLMNRPGGVSNDGQNYTNTRLTDSASRSIQNVTAADAPFTGNFRPFESFAAFANTSPNGSWTLTVVDSFAADDDGEFIDWTLSLFAGGDLFTFTDQNGRYRFVNVEPGTYPVRAFGPEGWPATQPIAGSHSATVEGPLSESTGFDFGYYRPDAIYGRVAVQSESGLPPAEDAPGVPDVKVYVDLDTNGQLAPEESFSQTNTPDLPIPDDIDAGVSDTIEISAQPFARMSKVTVGLNITHTYVADLQVFLQSPNGQEILLIDQRGTSGDNFTDTVLDDDALLPISGVTAGDAPFTGSYRPQTPLSTLYMGQVNGNWTLRVADLAEFDTGTFDNWTLSVDYSPEPTEVSDSFGNYRIDRRDLPSGLSLNVRAHLEPPVLLTYPASGGYSVIYPVGDSSHQIDFGVFVPDSIFGDRFQTQSAQ